MAPAKGAGRKKRTLPIAPHRRNKSDGDEEGLLLYVLCISMHAAGNLLCIYSDLKVKLPACNNNFFFLQQG